MNSLHQNPDDHTRTIIHLDLDCFYAQVEMIKNPQLRSVPLGIQQKNIVVTSNYIAREFGVKKCMLLTEAKKVCPNLHLVNGENLHDYRQTSYRITDFLHQYSSLVERLGLDENFVDVTSLVEDWLKHTKDHNVKGHIIGDTSEMCQCGCQTRLAIGTQIAQEIRNDLFNEFGLTSCAGIAHNKLLAKIVCSQHKPNQQSVVFPYSVCELMLSVGSVMNIPGIGRSTAEQLRNINILTVSDLQNSCNSTLENILGKEKSKIIKQLSYGIDLSLVKISGRPHSIGLEDSCKSLTAEKEIREKLLQLLNRLLLLVEEDGRIPRTIKLTVRKFNKNTKTSHRETRQCNISTSFFGSSNFSELTPSNLTRIMKVIMTLLSKMVNISQPYHITLLGLAFTKFNEKPNAKHSIASFLKQNLEVQSVTSIENINEDRSSGSVSPSMLNLNLETSKLNIEPCPKKMKCNLLMKRRNDSDCEDSASPSKLRVADLHLQTPDKNSDSNSNILCPPDVDSTVFKELPVDMQKELWNDYRNKSKNYSHPQVKKTKPNSLLNYFSKV